MSFSYPYLLLLLLLIPLFIVFIILKDKKRHTSLKYSDINQFSKARKTWRIKFRLIPDYLRVLIIAIIIIAIARPHFYLSKDNKDIEGINIVVALDVSPSMLSEDFKPNRLECAKSVAKEFIENRTTDAIGLVVFSGEAFTQCPPTIDHNVLLHLLSTTESGNLEDGTAIGDGLAVAINRIKDSKTKSKVIILITDGVNNTGQVDPISAANFAKQYGIRVYTIGVGKQGYAPYPYQTPFGKQYQNVPVEIDEGLLKNIAKETSGKYFRSTENSSLENIFQEIDKMEKSRINVSFYQQTRDVGYRFVFVALILLVLESFLRFVVFRSKF
ncbi:MAG: VWA domain-containing protein [Bacteroidales bacterium]|nr:VWA domain-containing protein [Bacteroidales bacterium]